MLKRCFEQGHLNGYQIVLQRINQSYGKYQPI